MLSCKLTIKQRTRSHTHDMYLNMLNMYVNPGGFPSKTNVHLTKTFCHCEGDFVCVYVCVCEWEREKTPKRDFVCIY